MYFFLVTCNDFDRLNKAVNGLLEIASSSQLQNPGSGCFYTYFRIVASKDTTIPDPGSDAKISALFGSGPEPKRISVRLISSERASELLEEPMWRWRKKTITCSPDWPNAQPAAGGGFFTFPCPEVIGWISAI